MPSAKALLLNGVRMIAIDTNIIARFLVRDDEQQFQKAFKLFSGSARLFIPTTVILETEWVLRFSYRFPADKIIYALSGLLNLANVTIENKQLVSTALEWHQQGMDFADALHFAGSLHAEKFASFDKKLLKKAALLDTGVEMLDI